MMSRSSRESLEELIAEAEEAAARAYVPYSGFAVGAVAVTADGSRFIGANVENAAFGSTICAEASAISAAVTAGQRQIRSVVVASARDGVTTPCGNCRQIMSEFGVERLVLRGADGRPALYEITALVPLAFGPDDLARVQREASRESAPTG